MIGHTFTDYAHVDWLLSLPPRQAQLEAVSRAYYGKIIKDSIDEFPLPRDIPAATTRPCKGYAHFLQMRLGKTAVALNEFALFRRDWGFRRMIVIAPNKYKADWVSEAARFGLEIPGHVFESRKRADAAAFVKENDECLISVNYEALVSHDSAATILTAVNDDTMLVFDESILIKNRAAITTKRAIVLAKRAGAVRLLTGKPMVQGPQDFYAQLNAIGLMTGMSFFAFRNQFCIMGGYLGKQVVGVKNATRLNEIVETRGFVAKRSDWMDTHAVDYEIRKVDMTVEQRRAYKEFDEEFSLEVSGQLISAEQAVTKAMKLQQISSGFLLDSFRTPHTLVPMEHLPKFLDMIEQLENEVEGKAIILANFNHTINELMRLLGPKRSAIIRGGMDAREAQHEKQRFNETKDCRFIIGQFKAIKYGHTLMGNAEDPCLDTFYFENSYSLDDRAQTEERNQGAGQLGRTHIVDYVTNPVDKKIVKALQRKESISAAIIGAYR
jgi:hypothetical protein